MTKAAIILALALAWVAPQAQATSGTLSFSLEKTELKVDFWMTASNQPCKVSSWAHWGVEEVTWSGDCVDGKATGEGRAVWRYDDPSHDHAHEGTWMDGKQTGHGFETEIDGTIYYKGEYRDDRRHGQGVLEVDGGRYEGEWRTGSRHGFGTATWSSGNRYEGEWHDNSKHGFGTFTWANGERYEGKWRDDSRYGFGILTWPDGNRYEGEWRDDRANGYGIVTSPDGRRHKGEWRDGCLAVGNIEAWFNTTAAECGFE